MPNETAQKELNIAFIGNPNCGKTTLFNAYTGAHLKVANWPGVTVEKKEGAMRRHGHEYKLVDLPGTYSLTSYTMEEQVSRDYILSDEVDVVVDVADASALERNLYLTLQLIELGKPLVLALNMMDIVQQRGMEIDLHRLPEMLGIPVIPVSAAKKTGLEVLIHAVAHHNSLPYDTAVIHHHDATMAKHPHEHHYDYVMVYSDEVEDAIDVVKEALRKAYPGLKNLRWHAIKHLENDPQVCRDHPVTLPDGKSYDLEQKIINQRYAFIDEIMDEVVVNRQKQVEFTDKIDRILTHKVLGLPVFLGIMAFVFFLTFTIGDWVKVYFEQALGWLTGAASQGLAAIHVSPVFISLVVDGILSGVGGILTFLPNIVILFIALALLEDSGYMSRIAFVMDGIMGRIGLSGRAFIPMLLGFGCTVPAIMASRALEDKRDRLKTILVTPFMSCSARLPVYVLFSQMFFPRYAMWAAFSMYVIGLGMAILVAFVLHIADRKKGREQMLLIELPEYKRPAPHTVFIYVWEKVKDYLTKAGTTIFIASVIMWVLLNFGPTGYVSDMSASFGSMLGRLLTPLFAPIGLGYWQLVVALIAGIAAKEVVVSSCSVLFGVGNVTSADGMSALAAVLGAAGFGGLNAFVMMLFCLLYVPCVAALATIRKETQSLRWTAGAAAFQLAVAWTVCFGVFQIGSLLM